MLQITIIIVFSIFAFCVLHWLWPDDTRQAQYREPEPPPDWIPPDINEPPIGQLQPEPYIPDWHPEWWLKLAELGCVDPLSPEADELDEWVYEVIQTAYVQFEGRLSPKIKLYPLFRSSEYDHIPQYWRSLKFFEGLSRILREAKFAEVKSKRYGLRLTEKGIEQFNADPDRWYP